MNTSNGKLHKIISELALFGTRYYQTDVELDLYLNKAELDELDLTPGDTINYRHNAGRTYTVNILENIENPPNEGFYLSIDRHIEKNIHPPSAYIYYYK